MSNFERDKSTLTPKQERALDALLRSPSIQAAAVAAGCGTSTLRRWLGTPVFDTAYQAARARLLETTLNQLQSVGAAAIEALHEILVDKTAPPASRVAASRHVLDLMLRARETLEIENRLQEIEARLGATRPQPTKLRPLPLRKEGLI